MNTDLYRIEDETEYDYDTDAMETPSSVVDELILAVESLNNIYNVYDDLGTEESFKLALESTYTYVPSLRTYVSFENDKVGFKQKITKLANAAWQAFLQFFQLWGQWITGYAKTKEKRESVIKELNEKITKVGHEPKKNKVDINKNFKNIFYTNTPFSINEQVDYFSKEVEHCLEDLGKLKDISTKPLDEIAANLDNLSKSESGLPNKDLDIKDEYFLNLKVLTKPDFLKIVKYLESIEPLLEEAETVGKLYEEFKQKKEIAENENFTTFVRSCTKRLKSVKVVVARSVTTFIAYANFANYMLKQYDLE